MLIRINLINSIIRNYSYVLLQSNANNKWEIIINNSVSVCIVWFCIKRSHLWQRDWQKPWISSTWWRSFQETFREIIKRKIWTREAESSAVQTSCEFPVCNFDTLGFYFSGVSFIFVDFSLKSHVFFTHVAAFSIKLLSLYLFVLRSVMWTFRATQKLNWTILL